MQRILTKLKSFIRALNFSRSVALLLGLIIILLVLRYILFPLTPTTNNRPVPDGLEDQVLPINPETGLPTIPYDEENSESQIPFATKFQKLVDSLPYKGNGYYAYMQGEEIFIDYRADDDIYRQAALMYLKSFGLDENTPHITVAPVSELK